MFFFLDVLLIFCLYPLKETSNKKALLSPLYHVSIKGFYSKYYILYVFKKKYLFTVVEQAVTTEVSSSLLLLWLHISVANILVYFLKKLKDKELKM